MTRWRVPPSLMLTSAFPSRWNASPRSLAKSEVTEACVFVTTDCVQLHGGVGFTWDFDPHIFLKRARLNEVLVMANTALRDHAAAALAAITVSGRSALELEL